MADLIIRENKEDYSPEEAVLLCQAAEQLLNCEQGSERSLEETRTMVAYRRYKQEGNFKVVAPKPPKVVKERKPKKLTKTRFIELHNKVLECEELSTEDQADYVHSCQFWEHKI